MKKIYFFQNLRTESSRELRDKTLCPVRTVEVAKLAEISGENCIPVTSHKCFFSPGMKGITNIIRHNLDMIATETSSVQVKKSLAPLKMQILA